MKSRKIDISIIITFGNDEHYLEECVESILCNNCDLELLFLNVGSTDGSTEIIDSYRVKYSNITTNKQPHKNIAAARNYGIKIASGEYLMFMSAFDMLTLQLKEMYNQTVETES